MQTSLNSFCTLLEISWDTAGEHEAKFVQKHLIRKTLKFKSSLNIEEFMTYSFNYAGRGGQTVEADNTLFISFYGHHCSPDSVRGGWWFGLARGYMSAKREHNNIDNVWHCATPSALSISRDAVSVKVREKMSLLGYLLVLNTSIL